MEPTRESSSETPKLSLEQRLGQIASDLGFNETDALKEIKGKLNPKQSLQESIAIISEYHILGETIVAKIPDDPKPQIGLIVAIAGLQSGNGFYDYSKQSVQDAITYAREIGDIETVRRLRTIFFDDFNVEYRKKD